MRKILFALIFVFVMPVMAELSDTDNKLAIERMEYLVKDVEDKILKKNVSQEQKNKHFDEILVSQMDLNRIANFIVGKPWKEAGDKQKDNFLKAFRHFQVLKFRETFNSYTNEEIKITGTLPSSSKNQTFVEMKIISKDNQGQPVDVKWKILKENDGSFKITDVVIEGISMASSLKQEYAGILNNASGDKLDYLTHQIEEKSKQFK
ncbi:MAG: ABC transporter substrate-binding protein [Rickettsiales bacterium]|jgi:phospholipid transport system substrate-binding protein|nr:ABC transporter substrate-binding protein [Rickettsiales bacterium]